MEFQFFDTEEIYERVEREAKGDLGDCILGYDEIGFSHRWIQPPVACYFVSTLDEHGNVDMAPISMGSATYAEPPGGSWYFTFDVQNSRQTRDNLMRAGECVISYYTTKLMKESWIAGLPLPRGISEIDVAKLTPLPSQKVRPCGVAECVSNLECRVEHTYGISNSTIFIAKVVAVSVNKASLERDKATNYNPGIVMDDLLYEVCIAGAPPRLTYTRMNLEHLYHTDFHLGDDKAWIGTFASWMESEERRGQITAQEREHILQLGQQWEQNPDPKHNAGVKDELTNLLTDLVWRGKK